MYITILGGAQITRGAQITKLSLISLFHPWCLFVYCSPREKETEESCGSRERREGGCREGQVGVKGEAGDECGSVPGHDEILI